MCQICELRSKLERKNEQSQHTIQDLFMAQSTEKLNAIFSKLEDFGKILEELQDKILSFKIKTVRLSV